MVNCKEIARILGADELADAGLSERARVRLHLLFCRHCRRYAAQIETIGAAGRELWSECPEDREALDRLELSILQGMQEKSDTESQA